MSETPGSEEQLNPAERAVFDHLALLRDDPPMAGATLVKKVVSTARWQQAFRRPLFVIESVASAIKGGLELLFAQGGRR